MSLLSEYRRTRTILVSDTLLLAGDPNGERWSTTRAAIEVNNATLDFAIRTQIVKDEINIQLKENKSDYHLPELIEADGTKKYYGYPLRVGFSGTAHPALWPTTMKSIDVRGYQRDEKLFPSKWWIDSMSPTRLAVFTPTADGADPGDADPYENNIQVGYVALPNYMTTGASYPDSHIPAVYHPGIPYGAAARLLDEGDFDDVLLAIEMDKKFEEFINQAEAETWRGETHYSDFRPC